MKRREEVIAHFGTIGVCGAYNLYNSYDCYKFSHGIVDNFIFYSPLLVEA